MTKKGAKKLFPTRSKPGALSFEAFVAGAMAVGKPPPMPMPKKAKAKKRKSTK